MSKFRISIKKTMQKSSRKFMLIRFAALIIGFLVSACSPEPPTKELIGGVCAVDAVNGTNAETVTVDNAKSIVVSGWILDDVEQRVPQGFSVLVVGQDGIIRIDQPGKAGTKRPDVATAFGNSRFEDAGFDITVNLGKLESGDYRIKLSQKIGTASLICNTRKAIRVQ